MGPRCQSRVLFWAAMALALPRTLTPSKVTSFTNCPLAFQFTVIEHRPEPPSPHAVKGTLVHSALEGLMWNHMGSERTEAAATFELERAWAELASDPEYVELGLTEPEADAFLVVSAYLRSVAVPDARACDAGRTPITGAPPPTGTL